MSEATMAKKEKEKSFLNALRDVFVGVPVEGESGYINLMGIKARYYEEGVFPHLMQDIDAAVEPFDVAFREELFDKLYAFFHRYFSESGSIYYRYTPLHERVYEQVYTNDRDVMLFWKTHMLYYVKTDRLFQSMDVELDGWHFHFDVSALEHKRSNEKRSLVFEFKELRADDHVVFNVTYAERGRKTKLNDVRKGIKNAKGLARYTEAVPSEDLLERAFRLFERQSVVDYFINKNARAFLREQLDLWLYQYMFSGQTEFSQTRVRQLQVIKDIACRIIDVIAQFEDELVRIWNKPKFVLNSNYVITLDRVAARDAGMVQRLAEHPGFSAQVEEWRKLGMVNNGFSAEAIWEEGLFGERLNPRFQHLPLDTCYFKDIELEILGLFDNLDQELDGWLIKSENYQALNTLLPKFRERVQAIYIDPPFNLRSNADYHYLVNYKDATWITILENRIKLGREFLASDGSLFVRCDYNGNMLVRLLLNQILGDSSFGNEIVINRFRRQLGELTRLNVGTDSLFYYTKTSDPYFHTPLRKRICSFCGQEIEPNWRQMSSPGIRHPPERRILGRTLLPPRGRHWTFTQERIDRMEEEGRIRVNEQATYVDLEGNRVQGVPEYLQTEETPIDSVWIDLKGYVFGSSFSTENAEELLQRVIEVSSPEEALIMDFFLGSGTTTAASHKMGRKWIGIELDDHFESHILPRMKRVLNGEQTGISGKVEWKGGGFIKYYQLEQYEDTLRRAHYEEASLFDNPYEDPYCQYVFLRDRKMLDAIELDAEADEVRVDLSRLYKNIDVAETLSCVTGKWIRRITPELVEFEDGDKVDLQNPPWELIKPLIWW